MEEHPEPFLYSMVCFCEEDRRSGNLASTRIEARLPRGGPRTPLRCVRKGCTANKNGLYRSAEAVFIEILVTRKFGMTHVFFFLMYMPAF
ncbi:hypothetical protein D770_21165 [Flammeovirgaceae bacterium 311]|nr:hypothetical protein D770_21165 [Flammeovirgaceae bacterium 311]